jgi:NAD-dependent deacetylase
MNKKKIVFLTGAGISAESGIRTFRDSDGLWEGRDVMEVASPEGWAKNQPLVLEFYNQRRAQLKEVRPNDGHRGLAELEDLYDVHIITQNVDDLHERAGSKNVLHLHGELRKVRSTLDASLIYTTEENISVGDTCEKGGQLRPDIVWFGEAVPNIERAAEICATADIFVIIGTSMQVYPAAGLVSYVADETPKFYIDPKPAAVSVPNLTEIKAGAGEGVKTLKDYLAAL